MYEHFKGDEFFVKKVLEYIDQALYKQRIVLTKFLDPRLQSIVKSVVGKQVELQVLEEGGFTGSESKRLLIAPSFYQLEKEDFEIQVLKITYAKHFDTIQHSDVLGALMSLGIKREVFGDIATFSGDIYVAVDKKIYEYVKENMTKIKRSKVVVSKAQEEVTIAPTYHIKTFIISSFRLDKVVSVFYKIPRVKAAQYISSGFVKVNHKTVVETNFLCNNDDIISFRKHGRVVLVDVKRTTKSNKNVVEGYFYK